MTRRVYRSTDYGAPSLQYTNSTLIDVLTKCLVDGYGTQTINAGNVTRSGSTVTVTTPVAHGLTTTAKVTVAGANEAGYNGEFSVTVTSTTQFTYTIGSTPTTPATGTITVKLAGSGWTKPYTGTDLAAFKNGAGSNGLYLWVSDGNTQTARIRGYETMSDVNTGTNPFPTDTQLSGGGYVYKSSSTNSTSRRWTIIATEKCFFLHIMPDTDTAKGMFYGFGDFASYKSGDSFGTFIKANPDTNYYTGTSATNSIATAGSGLWADRSYTQTGSSVTVGMMADYNKLGNQSNFGAGGAPFPNPVDGGLLLSPIWVNESAVSAVRGEYPGVLAPLHNKPFTNDYEFSGAGAYAGKAFKALNLSSGANPGQILFEISDT